MNYYKKRWGNRTVISYDPAQVYLDSRCIRVDWLSGKWYEIIKIHWPCIGLYSKTTKCEKNTVILWDEKLMSTVNIYYCQINLWSMIFWLDSFPIQDRLAFWKSGGRGREGFKHVYPRILSRSELLMEYDPLCSFVNRPEESFWLSSQRRAERFWHYSTKVAQNQRRS